MDVDSVGVERPIVRAGLLIVDGNQHEIESERAQTVSCDRLPQRMAARMERCCLITSTRASRAALNCQWTTAGSGSAFAVVADFLAMPMVMDYTEK